MTVPQYSLIKHPHFRRIRKMHVILSEQSESKDLRTDYIAFVPVVRRSFDSGLRPALRMTDLEVVLLFAPFDQQQPPYKAKKAPESEKSGAFFIKMVGSHTQSGS